MTPALERQLHLDFDVQSVNKVNKKKEFFNVSLSDIRQKVNQLGVTDVHWTMKAEAAEYRESLALLKRKHVHNAEAINYEETIA